jgi:hypothetical protein
MKKKSGSKKGGASILTGAGLFWRGEGTVSLSKFLTGLVKLRVCCYR